MEQATVAGRGELYGGQTRQERESERRDRLVAAAVRLFATLDYEDVTVADVCARAKVSKRYFYDHFADRADLLAAVQQEQNDWLLRRLAVAVPERPADVAAFLRPVLSALVTTLLEDPERARAVYLNAPRRGRLREEARMFGAMVRPLLGPHDEQWLERTTLALVAGLSEVVTAWVTGGMTDPPGPLADHLTSIATGMLGTRVC